MNIKSIRATVLLTVIAIVTFATFVSGLWFYFATVSAKEDQIVEKSVISLQPILTLATRNIDGGNLMNLKNTGAQDLYKTNGNLLYVKMQGTSAGTPATDFSPAIPPSPVEFSWLKEGYREKDMADAGARAAAGKQAENGVSLDRKNDLLIVNKSLPIANKGAVTAVFSAKEMEGVGVAVLKSLALPFIIIMAVAVAVAVLVVSRIVRPIVAVAEKVTDVAKSLDLSARVQVRSENEVGALAGWFNKLLDRLEALIQSVNDLTAVTNQSATEISSSVEEQAAIATQQHASLTEVTTTVGELSATSAQIADNAGAVEKTASGALQESERGLEAIETLQAKMNEITADNKTTIDEIMDLGRKSKEIGKIMEIIDNIADQTKLIAFNAAIEASGAGEAGKRFSVVAVEIRRLADNVMESTSEIAGKIEEIQQSINALVVVSEKGSKQIQEGTHLARQTGAELLNLVEHAKAASDAAMQISMSTQQQKTATSQVLTALKEIEQGIRQSSIAMKQTTATTGNLLTNSEDLKVLLSEFKHAKNNGAHAA